MTDHRIPITRSPLIHLHRSNQDKLHQGPRVDGDLIPRGHHCDYASVSRSLLGPFLAVVISVKVADGGADSNFPQCTRLCALELVALCVDGYAAL